MRTDHPELDYLAIGHVSRDQTSEGSFLGGTVSYAGRTALALGSRVGIVTSCSADLDLSPLDGIDIFNLPSKHSTTFNNSYLDGKRSQRIGTIARNLGITSIPPEWRQTSIIHLGPIANEVDSDIIQKLDSTFIGVTLQGWLRGWDDDGRVHLNSWETTRGWLASANAVVLSIEDLQDDENAALELAEHCAILAVTRGPKGAAIFYQGASVELPVQAVAEIGSTGAGDIFAASFFLSLYDGANPRDAGNFANQLAAASVAKLGMPSTPTE